MNDLGFSAFLVIFRQVGLGVRTIMDVASLRSNSIDSSGACFVRQGWGRVSVCWERGLYLSALGCFMWRGWGPFQRDWLWGLSFYCHSCPWIHQSC